MNKRINADEAARLVRSGDTVASVGVIGWITPDALLRALADRFHHDSEPRDLTFYFPCGTGDSIDIRGMDHVAVEGLMRRIISGSYVNPLHPTKRTRPDLMRLIRENRIEAYSWPIGASMQWLREVARRSPGLMTEIGLGTYADPRQQGGKFTSLAKQDLIELIEFRGKPYLFYPTFPLNVAFIRASSADSFGNLSYEDEVVDGGSIRNDDRHSALKASAVAVSRLSPSTVISKPAPRRLSRPSISYLDTPSIRRASACEILLSYIAVTRTVSRTARDRSRESRTNSATFSGSSIVTCILPIIEHCGPKLAGTGLKSDLHTLVF